MKSMTGYGRASAAIANASVTVQVSSVNRKGLDVTVSLPGPWESLEPKVAALVRREAVRGKIHVEIELSKPAATTAQWDETAIGAVLDRLAALADARGMPFSASSELLWQIAQAQRPGTEAIGAEDAEPVVLKLMETALGAFSGMREQEGATLQTDFQARLSLIREHALAIGRRAPEVPKAYREILLKRLKEAGLELDLTDERVLKEIALFADRCDVTEELTRFHSHLDQLSLLLKGSSEIGRKSDFILQELGREANTIGSKANDLSVAKSVIELKNELERVREQMANVE